MPLSISSLSFFFRSEHYHCAKLVSTSVDLFPPPLQYALRKSFSLKNHKAHTMGFASDGYSISLMGRVTAISSSYPGKDMNSLTVLVLGKGGVGKSSTVSSLILSRRKV